MTKRGRMFLCGMACLLMLASLAAAGEFNNGLPPGYPVGRVIEGATMPSKILGKDVRYTVYLPPDYDLTTRTYPVFYLLHGGGSPDLDTDWVHKGEINHIMDKGILEGRFTPMIIIMPDGRRDENTTASDYLAMYYMNDADGGVRWADMFLEELIPYVEREYRVRTTPGPKRAIGGLSMGGYGCLSLAFQNPTMFSAVIALSPALFPEDQVMNFKQRDFERRFGKGYGAMGKEGKDRLTDDYRKKAPLAQMQSINVEVLKKMNLWIDCGAEDQFDLGSSEMHQFLKANGVKHHFSIRPGGHHWPFWRNGIVPAMEYVSGIFHRN